MTKMRHIFRSLYTSGPGILWISLFLLAPIAAIGVISFLSRGAYGEIEQPFTLENYTRFFGFGSLGFDPLYPFIVLRSLALGALTATLCVLVGLPMAFFIAGLRPGLRNIALILVIVPFWTNLLIRTYAWQIIMAPDSALSRLAAGLGFIAQGTPLCPGLFAVCVGMLCDYLPFMVLPLYASVEKLDWSLVDAAMDLGADNLRVLKHAIIPQVFPGLVAGIILVFIPASGQFIIPDLLGGSKIVMLGNAIAQQFGPSRDWPFGAAISFLSMSVVMLGLWLYARTAGEKGQESLL